MIPASPLGAPPQPLPQQPAPWHWRWLLAAPHRLAFFAGALLLAGAALWWAAAMLARSQGLAWPWALPPGPVHALLMGYSFIPMFFAGFLFTAGPKWLGRPEVEAASLRVPVFASLAGWLLVVLGTHFQAALAAGGLALVAASFANLTLRFARLLAASTARDKVHAKLVLAGCATGSVLLWIAAAALALELLDVVRAATQAGLWACIALVYVSVVHRMVPFFSAAALPALDAWRPMWLLWTLAGAVWFEAPLAAAEALWWPLPGWLRALQALVEAPLALLLLWLAVRWGLVQSLKVRLLAMLHLGFVWLGLAFALNAVSHALTALGIEGDSLGLAPLHALTMGFFGSTLVAMVTRVSCGHGGRALAADDFVWRLFWVLQFAIAARVGSVLAEPWRQPLITLAALAWAGAMLAWAMRYGRWYGQPRADGRPG